MEKKMMRKRKAADGNTSLLESWRPFLAAREEMKRQLTCSVCDDLLKRSTLLPCGHIVCSACITPSTGQGGVCPSCKFGFSFKDIKPVVHMDRVVSLFGRMAASVPDTLHKKCIIQAFHNDEENLCTVEQGVDSESSQRSDSLTTGNNRHSKIPGNDIAKECDSQHTHGVEEFKKPKGHLDMKSVIKPRFIFGDECVFCHSFRSTEASGPLMCYIDGKLVSCSKSVASHAIFVHRKCALWATTVYREGETVRNLEIEIQKSSKYICSKCGMNGAALGCYSRICKRIFHVPCAVAIPGCRWDCENLCVLCPSHVSEHLPCEVTVSQKKIEDEDSCSVEIPGHPGCSGKLIAEGMSYKSKELARPKSEKTFLGSDLLGIKKELLLEFVAWIDEAITERWMESVTHVIADTDKNGACKRTQEVLMAILTGKWILKTDWIDACLDAGQLVPEEPYEVCLDVRGFRDGPRRGRLRAIEKAPKLFLGLCFYFSEHFTLSYKQSLEELAVTAGGKVLKEVPSMPRQLDFKQSAVYFVYNEDPPKEMSSKVEVADERRQEVIEVVLNIGAQHVGHISFLDAIADSNIQHLNDAK